MREKISCSFWLVNKLFECIEKEDVLDQLLESLAV